MIQNVYEASLVRTHLHCHYAVLEPEGVQQLQPRTANLNPTKKNHFFLTQMTPIDYVLDSKDCFSQH